MKSVILQLNTHYYQESRAKYANKTICMEFI